MKLFNIIFMMLTLNTFLLAKNSNDNIINYEKYGYFKNLGTANYRYVITNRNGLKKAILPGIYPDFDGIKKDPEYIEANINGKLDGFLWDYIDKKRDPMINFFKWAVTTEEQLGVKLFYVGLALERAGRIKDAINAYYAILIHFPKTMSYTYWHNPLYIGRIVIDRIHQLTRKYPEFNLKLVDAKITILNTFDNNVSNDKYVEINPGKFITIDNEKQKLFSFSDYKVIETRGGNYVNVKKYNNNHWQLNVNNKPFFIHGMAYSPNQIGKSPDYGTLNVSKDWQFIDVNKNNINDVFFESYVDKNLNNKQDKDEPIIGDAKLMKDMGVNTLRLYHHCYNKKLFRKLYIEYGFHVIMGDFLGVYATGSGANWDAGTDYSDPEQRENMKNSVKEMVEEYKNEPYVLMWMLGNENNYGVANNSQDNPEVYYTFVQEVVKMVHKLDPTRPVGLCNGDLLYLDIMVTKCPDVDILGINAYRGTLGFGDSFWESIAETAGKPILISEYGCPAYAGNMSLDEAEQEQLKYHQGNWEDIINNKIGSGQGNSLGGVIFEWCDEWWKAGSGTDPNVHDTQPQFGAPFIDGWSYEEWLGLCSQGNGSDSPFLRQLRKSYFYYQDAWKK